MEINQQHFEPQLKKDISANGVDTFNTIVIGGGQAGLSIGYYLTQYGLPFVILDASERIGDSWRNRWDSLRLFTPASLNGLSGMPFPAPAHYFPTKDEMADYLASYAARFKLPVRSAVKVDSLSKEGNNFIVRAGDQRLEAKNVVVAMANHQYPRVPRFSQELDQDIVQLHSSEYRNSFQLRDGDVLVVGAGNSGAEIALELAYRHKTILSGRDTGNIPFRIEGFAARLFLFRLLLRFGFHHLMTIKTWIGRKMRSKMLFQGGPLIRIKPQDLMKAGIERVSKVAGARDGMPLLEDKRVLKVSNIIWCTGFHAGFSWINLPIIAENNGLPIHNRGITNEPGLYFTGLLFLYAASSSMVHGVARDARHIVKNIVARTESMKSNNEIGDHADRMFPKSAKGNFNKWKKQF
jgi:putative flavoprotein involved in K+ transport